MFIAWEDYRDNATSKADIYTQYIDKNGATLWPTNGRTVCTAMGNQQFPVICTDASNNSIVAWQDNRSVYILGRLDIYAQYITGLGHVVPGPMAPVLTTDATNPDSDGAFHLNWGAIFDADNYCVYRYTKPITSINSTITNLAINYLTHQYNVTGLSNGVYYFVVASVNEMGTTMSNVVQVNVQGQSGVSLGMFPVVFIFAGLAMLVVVVNRRKKLVS